MACIIALISDASLWYLENRATNANEIAALCVYALDCSGDRARLAIISDIYQFNFGSLRQRIWARRFKGICQGQTANLGLQIVRQDSARPELQDQAVWSFTNNRFISRNIRWAAFSEEPWERCSAKNATFLVEKGAAQPNRTTE